LTACRRQRCKTRVEYDGLCPKHLTKELDFLYGRLIHTRDPFCMRCGSNDWPECSHHISRERHGTRWDPDNACIHCKECHVYLTYHPNIHVEWIIDFIGQERYEALLDKAYGVRDDTGRRTYPVEPDRPALLEWLRAETGEAA